MPLDGRGLLYACGWTMSPEGAGQKMPGHVVKTKVNGKRHKPRGEESATGEL